MSIAGPGLRTDLQRRVRVALLGRLMDGDRITVTSRTADGTVRALNYLLTQGLIERDNTTTDIAYIYSGPHKDAS